MKSNEKFLAGVILGAAAATALAVFFTSDKGKEVFASAKDTAEKLTGDLKTKLQSLEGEMKTLLKKGKAIEADIAATVSADGTV
ncbi:hypothetical protein [Parasediminibacterium sp. JCM 36343]|uniref:hypothetical protein n=1 Tax=Parasediminibacterium sp. JCM 36343 TaxID=3374279 RepID=UPI00397BBEC2